MQKSFHKSFSFLNWELNEKNHTLILNYHIEKIGKVSEVLTFPNFKKPKNNEINAACELIHLMCGVSYYKAGLAENIIFENKSPTNEMLAFTKKTWFHGLAELAFENKISLKDRLSFNINDNKNTGISLNKNRLASSNSLVAIGGGKDSLVTIEEIKAQGKNINLFMVGNSQLIKDVAKFIDLPLIQVHRKIDRKLIEYNKTGDGFNGHIPITAINSAIGVLTALLFDCNEVVFSNEKSADSANTINQDGDEVNHQYSKSHEFEKDFSNILFSEVTKNIDYYSQQRGFSELEILEKFSKYPQYFPVFSSCNRNFHIDGSRNKNKKWCGDCPKCRFIFLGLAPFVSKEQLLEIFGTNLLDNLAQKKGFEELLGIRGFKPFECVGEIEESQKAFEMIHERADWKNDALINIMDSKSEIDLTVNSKLDQIKNKKLAIWGFGVEGKATAKYLKAKGIEFKVLCREEEKDCFYSCITKQVNSELLDRFDIIIKSPGISPYTDLVNHAKCAFTSPTAIWFANEKNTKVIVVTGTKGKSTSVSLLTHVMSDYGLKVNLVGNIGEALIGSSGSSSDFDFIILEASSFQIYDGNIEADIAVITNLFPEHIDWHQGVDNYFSDKLKLLQNSKVKILNADNATLNELIIDDSAQYFNKKTGYHVINNALFNNDKLLLNSDEIQLIGNHNLENIAAVLMVCDNCNLNQNKILKSIKQFKPLAHRLQSLGKIGKCYAINDSIATTPMATIAALTTVDLSNTTLLIGGYDRGHDWTNFVDNLIDFKPKLIIVSGQNADLICTLFESSNSNCNYIKLKTLKDSIKLAVDKTPENGLILLSPGAPSFDQFDSYIKRGIFFEKELMKYV